MRTRNPEYENYRRRHTDEKLDELRNTLGINWPSVRTPEVRIAGEVASDEDLLEESENYEEYGEEEVDVQDFGYSEDRNQAMVSHEPLRIGKKPINLAKFQTKKQEQETEKVTIYLDRNLVSVLKILKQNKSISSYSQCIAEALEQYLTS